MYIHMYLIKLTLMGYKHLAILFVFINNSYQEIIQGDNSHHQC